MDADDRKRKLDSIARNADQLSELARRYERLRYMAEEDATGAFLNLAEAAGHMTTASLAQLSALLDILFSAQLNIRGKP